jgi:molecular chaperone GrpE
MAGDPAVKPSEEVETAAAVSTATAPSGGAQPEAAGAAQEPVVRGAGAPEDGAGAPEEAAAAPEDGAGAPEDGAAAPDDGAGAPEDGAGAPEDGAEAPEEAAAVPGVPSDADLEALAEKAARADEYLELAQRTRADFENYRRRAARDAAAAQERGVARLAKELLAAVDNLDRALAAAEAQATGGGAGEGADGRVACEQLLSGIRLVHADVLAAFARLGIEPFSPVGERFDPQFHEAVAQQPCEGAQTGTVVEVYQVGYRLGDGVLRPARVLVAA